jgi:hypothetical protein
MTEVTVGNAGIGLETTCAPTDADNGAVVPSGLRLLAKGLQCKRLDNP